MANLITPEVRAAIERQRDARDGHVPWEYAGTEGTEAYNSDLEAIRNAMLSMFPSGMPEPWIITRDVRDVEKPTAYRGLFIPLERVGQ